MQQLVKRSGLDTAHRLMFGDQTFIDEINGDFQRRLGGALAVAGLQHP